MANVTGFREHPDNPQWISLTFDDGSQSPFAHDPTGEFRQQSTAIADRLAPPRPAPYAGALAMNDAAPAALPVQNVSPQNRNALADIPDAAMAGLGWAAPLVQQAQTTNAAAEAARVPEVQT